MKKVSLMLLCLLFGGLSFMYAQTQITGTVTSSEDGEPLPGVSVVVQGTTIGTATDVNGSYTLSVPDEANALIFSSVGYASQDVPISGRSVINVAMESDVVGLDEVVVTALGISREKKGLGYSVQQVDGEDINRVKNENIINSIAGRVAGVHVKNNTNMGGSSNVIIRGSSSLTGNNQALFVVDGVPVSNLLTNNSGQMSGRNGYDYGNPVSDVNPDDVESVSVLKGAAATALYGSRAANGVIIITTKKGEKSKTGKNIKVDLSHSTMFHTMDKATFPEHQQQYGAGYGPYYSSSEYPGLYYYDLDGDGEDDYVVPSTEDASRGSEFNPDLMVFQWDAFFPESPNYLQKSPYVPGANGPESFFETGRTLRNTVNISGGTTASTFRLSYTNTDQTGIMPNSLSKKNSINFSGGYDVLDNLKVSASAIYTNTYTKGRNSTGYSDNILSMFRQWYNVGVDMQQQQDFYELTNTNITWNPNSEDNLTPIYWDNPYWQRYENYQDDERDRLIGYTQVDWSITSDLSFMSRFSVDNYSFIQQERKAIGSVSGEFGVDRPDVRSGYARNDIFFTETNFDAMLQYNRAFSPVFDFSAMLGTNIRRVNYERVRTSTNGGLAVPEVYGLSNSVDPMLPPEEVLQRIGVNGYFGDVSLGFSDMVFIDGTIRYDISSTLPVENYGYVYPSVSTSFVFSELTEAATWLNFGKIRLNWAQVGKDAPWGSVEDAYRIVAPFNGRTLVRFPSYKNNPNLKPEISSSLEAGLEMYFFNNRFGFDIAAYQKNSVNQTVPLTVSRSTGFASKFVNIGEIENKGLEVLATIVPVKNAQFLWNIGLNWSKNINKVISLGDDIDNLQIAALQGGVTINAREGEPYGVIQGTDFNYAPDGQKLIRGSGYYETSSTSDNVIGSIQPDWLAGITNEFSYKGVTLNFLVDMQMGGDIFSLDMWYGMATGLYPETVELNDLGNPERDPIVQNEDGTYAPESGGILYDGVVGIDNDSDGEYDEYVPNTHRISGFNYGADGYATNPNARYVYDASYVKLREASISYSLPNSLLLNTFLKGATISVIGSNLWIIHKNLPYADPEASQGAGNVQGWQSGVFPTTRNIGFNVNLTF